MNVETRGRTAAAGLRSATPVDVEAGLSRLRRTRRRRDVGRVVAAGAVVAAVVGGSFAAMDRDEKVLPADDPALRNGQIVNAGEREFGAVPALPTESPYPLWQGVDPASGSFMYAVERRPALADVVAIVDESGTVAQVECPTQPFAFSPYPGQVAFGPGDEELTFTSSSPAEPPRSLMIVGFDGDIREEIHLPEDGLPDDSFQLMAWSPDGRELAVALEYDFEARTGEVWVISRTGGEARLIHREQAPEELVDGSNVNTPLIVDLAWSPDGTRLGILVANEFQGEEGAPAEPARPHPRLIAIPVDGGDARTLHTYDFRNTHSTVPANFIRNWAFAWSPDGQRIAVTNEGGIAEISATDGIVLTEHPGFDDYGPLVWLPE